ncbi:MAG: biopolymer transporter ExbD [Thermosynechococcaceae cyanobacterium]
MKVFLEPDDLDVRIELIPLIDVIFCILVFFILGAVSFARTEGLNVDLPQADSAQTQLGETLPVEVDALGQIKIENTTVTEDQLKQLLAAYVRQKPQGIVVLQADKLVSYGQVARLIDTLQQVGGTRVALGATIQSPIPQSGNNNFGGTVPTVPIQPQPNLGQPLAPELAPGVPLPAPGAVDGVPLDGAPQTTPPQSNPTLPPGVAPTSPDAAGNPQ